MAHYPAVPLVPGTPRHWGLYTLPSSALVAGLSAKCGIMRVDPLHKFPVLIGDENVRIIGRGKRAVRLPCPVCPNGRSETRHWL